MRGTCSKRTQSLLPLLTTVQSTSPFINLNREMAAELQNLHSNTCLCTQSPNNDSDLSGGRQLGRRLVVAFDGTENQFGLQVHRTSPPRIHFMRLQDQSSHIVEFYSHIVRSSDQLSYYTSGIGTFVQPSSIAKRPHMLIKNKWAAMTAR